MTIGKPCCFYQYDAIIHFTHAHRITRQENDGNDDVQQNSSYSLFYCDKSKGFI